MADEPTTVKKPRTKKLSTNNSASGESITSPALTSETTFTIVELDSLIEDFQVAKETVEKLEKTIIETKANWRKEQKTHEQELEEQEKLRLIERTREQETYDYETKLDRKRAQDEFEEKKSKWEKELASQKEQIDSERKELSELRIAAENYPQDKDKAINLAVTATEKSLKDQFDQDKKFLAQQHKSEIDVQTLKISNLENENSRQTKEIESLKKSLEEVTRQFRDVAVKAIEGTHSELKTATSQS